MKVKTRTGKVCEVIEWMLLYPTCWYIGDYIGSLVLACTSLLVVIGA